MTSPQSDRTCPLCDWESSHDHCIECGARNAMPWEHDITCSHYRPATEFDTPASRAALTTQPDREALLHNQNAGADGRVPSPGHAADATSVRDSGLSGLNDRVTASTLLAVAPVDEGKPDREALLREAFRVLVSLTNRDIEAQFENIFGQSLDDVALRTLTHGALPLPVQEQDRELDADRRTEPG